MELQENKCSKKETCNYSVTRRADVCQYVNWLLQNRTFSGKASATSTKIALPKRQNIFLGKATALNPQILHPVLSCPCKELIWEAGF